ncbi:MAG: methyl-accepting chemotaxis protein [Firmicutes bacterium]|nr:methyl-accepting chemotaxis protein [Bacillota bacterium]
MRRKNLRTQVLGMVLLAGLVPFASYTFFLMRYFDAKSILHLFWMTTIPSCILLVFVTRRLSSQLLGPIEKMARVLRLGAQGDLAQSIDIKANNELQELGGLINDLFASLRDMIKEMGSVSQQTSGAATALNRAAAESAAAAREIAATVSQIAGGAEEQSVAAEQGLVSMQNVLSQAQAIAEESGASLSASKLMAEQAETMGQVLHDLIDLMKQLADENLIAAEAARHLADQAQAI